MSSRIAACSCSQLTIACQRRTGSVFATLAAFAAPFEVRGTTTEYVRVGDQGSRYTFRFCPVCGTNLFHTDEGDETFVMNSVYECRKHAWVQLPSGVKAYERDPI